MTDNVAMIEGWGGFPGTGAIHGCGPHGAPRVPNPWEHLPTTAAPQHDPITADASRLYRQAFGHAPANTNQERAGRFIRTHSGRKFWPHDPRPEDMSIEDIAWALSRIQRYGGHANADYSVAEHCVIGARYITGKGYGDDVALAFLLHDATEAFGIGDVSAPAKHNMPEYKMIERRISEAVQKRFGVRFCAIVEQVDAAISTDEMIALMHGPEEGAPQPLGVKIHNWRSDIAHAEFMREFHYLPSARARALA